MEKKEYLNEEKYKSAKKKIVRISLMIFIVSVLIGGGLIVTGIIKTDSYKTNEIKLNEERKARIEAEKARIEEEKVVLTTQYDSKKQECDSIPPNTSDWFSKTSQCNREANAIYINIMDLETEKFELDNGLDNGMELKVPIKSYVFLFTTGRSIILLGVMFSLIFYLIAKKREIKSFMVQQSMPVAQEAIEKMAPTIGGAIGTIAKGIKENLKEEKK